MKKRFCPNCGEETWQILSRDDQTRISGWGCSKCKKVIAIYGQEMRLYYHKTDGGAEYLFDTFIECKDGHKEGVVRDGTKYIIRIDGDIEKDAELVIRPGDE